MELEPAPIARQSAVACRGTCCYRTVDGQHVVKFSWVSADKWLTEPDLLRATQEKKVKGVAQLAGRRQVAVIADLRSDLRFTKRKRLDSRLHGSGLCFSGSQLGTMPLSDNSGKRKSIIANESFCTKKRRSNSQTSRLSQVQAANESFNRSQGSQSTQRKAHERLPRAHPPGSPFATRIL